MPTTRAKYACFIHFSSLFMPEGEDKCFVKHEGPIIARNHNQHRFQKKLRQRQIEEFKAAGQDPFESEIHERNLTRAGLREHTKEAGDQYNRFPTPQPPEDPRAASRYKDYIAAKPYPLVLKTDHIPDVIWYSKEFQSAPNKQTVDRDWMDIVEVAFIVNKLASGRDEILRQYRVKFPTSLHEDDTVLRVIEEVEWKAKEECFSLKECHMLNVAIADGLRRVDSIFDRFAQEWPLYPKSRDYIYQACVCLFRDAFLPAQPV